jgi:hypothetical protein
MSGSFPASPQEGSSPATDFAQVPEPEPPPLPIEQAPPLPETSRFDLEPPALPIEETPPLPATPPAPEMSALPELNASPRLAVARAEPPAVSREVEIVVGEKPPHKPHLSITAFIAAALIIPSFVPLFGIISCVLVFALSEAVLKAKWAGPLYGFSIMLAMVCRIAAITVLVLQLLYGAFLTVVLFASYQEFMDDWHATVQFQEEQLNFVKEVWHHFFG